MPLSKLRGSLLASTATREVLLFHQFDVSPVPHVPPKLPGSSEEPRAVGHRSLPRFSQGEVMWEPWKRRVLADISAAGNTSMGNMACSLAHILRNEPNLVLP